MKLPLTLNLKPKLPFNSLQPQILTLYRSPSQFRWASLHSSFSLHSVAIEVVDHEFNLEFEIKDIVVV